MLLPDLYENVLTSAFPEISLTAIDLFVKQIEIFQSLNPCAYVMPRFYMIMCV